MARGYKIIHNKFSLMHPKILDQYYGYNNFQHKAYALLFQSLLQALNNSHHYIDAYDKTY
jgi:hypothetical protein